MQNSELRIADCGLRIADCGFQISDFKSQISNLTSQISHRKFHISNLKSQICPVAVALLLTGLLLSGPSTAQAAESLPPGAKLVKIEADPPAIELAHRFDYRQLLLTGTLESGERIDITRIAQLEATPAWLSVSEGRLIRPLADGSGELRFALDGQFAYVPVKASGTNAAFDVSYVRHVMPTMSKMGCNAGTCHGAAQGKNGFKLSLRGYDPHSDYLALTDDLAARRFNRAAPEQSLMLLKPSGAVPHVGGMLTQPGEPNYELLKAWIAAEAKFDADSPRVSKVEVRPISPIISLPEMKQQMAVLATYSDGSSRDVTAEAFVESGNIEIVEADKQGLVTALRRGEAPVLVRFEGAYAATTITVMGDRSGFTWTDVPANNYIDELVYDKLKRVKTLPSDLCTDAEFVRRIYLDLTGLPPSAEQVRQFLADARDGRTKRDELVDRLIGSPEFVEHWTNKWADLLQVNSKFLGDEGASAFRNWIRQAVAGNVPYDQFVYTVLTASGSNLENPPASYYKVLREPDAVMENTTQLFLGVRFNCNKCHDHPFERWTQNQHWELAAYFAKVGRKDDPKFADKKIGGSAVEQPRALVEVIYDQAAGEVRHPNTNAVLTPSFPYEHSDMTVAAEANERLRFAQWATSEKNEYFAKSYVNRMWSYLTGVGFIEPVDDIRAGNPPTNPELLEKLTADFISGGFNVQELMRLICKSRVYQLSINTNKWNEDDQINYSHAIARRLPAEVLYDTVYQVTGSTRRLQGMPVGARAAEQRDASITQPDGFLDLFGRPPRESACECERSGGVMLGQTLNLINGPTIADAIADPSNGIGSLLASEKDDAKVVDELFVRILNRPASTGEIEAGVKAMRSFDEEHAVLEAQLAEYEKALPAKQAEWEKAQQPVSWTPVKVVETKSAAGATFAVQDDGSVLVEGKLEKDTYTVVAHSDQPTITGIRLEALADPRLPVEGPGRAPNGNMVLSELRVTAAPQSDPAAVARAVALQQAVADFSQQGYHVTAAIDGNPQTGWALYPTGGSKVGRTHVAAFETKDDVTFAGGTILTFTLDHQYFDGKHNLGKFRLSVTGSARPLTLEGPPKGIAEIVTISPEQRSQAQKDELARHFRSLDLEMARLTQAVAEHEKQRVNSRLLGAQDLVWALLNSPAFLFNR